MGVTNNRSLPLPSSDAGGIDDARFESGKNWQRYLSVLDDSRIEEAVRSLEQMLGAEGLAGRSFIDVGSGSGLYSLAAVVSVRRESTRWISTRGACNALPS